jgi:prepilin-type N-terminal cleavage/methylation domain-containing protein
MSAASKLTTQKGMTLTELLVALVMGLAIGGSVLYLYVASIATHNRTEAVTQLEEELAAAMNVMTRDIRRAGYSLAAYQLPYGNVTTGTGSFTFNENPFQEIFLADQDGDGRNDCILYSYDQVLFGTQAVAAGDYSGVRLGADAGRDIIQIRQDSTDADDCSQGTWQALTSYWVSRDLDLEFTLSTTTLVADEDENVLVTVRNVRVDLTATGQTPYGEQFTRTLSETIRLRNDELVDGP